MEPDPSEQLPKKESIQRRNKPLETGFDLTARQATARMVAALRKAHATPPKEQKDMKRQKPAKLPALSNARSETKKG
jgi:hypothetical protein